MTPTTLMGGGSRAGSEPAVAELLERARSDRAKLDGNVADCFRHRIDHETFVARNAAIWREIEAEGRVLVVEALLRGGASEAGACAQRLVDGVLGGSRPHSPATVPGDRDRREREVRMPYKDA